MNIGIIHVDLHHALRVLKVIISLVKDKQHALHVQQDILQLPLECLHVICVHLGTGYPAQGIGRVIHVFNQLVLVLQEISQAVYLIFHCLDRLVQQVRRHAIL